ncbi:MAG: enolase C-terminal domain-like protein [Candidatus Pacearchaeota archaeon]
MFIREVKPRLIKNSRGERTIEITIKTYEGKFTASAPSGKSRGKNEVEPYHSKGIGHSLRIMKVLSRKLKYKNLIIKKLEDLKKLDDFVRKFESRFGQLGGNFKYALETVVLKAAAKEKKKEFWELISETGKVKIPMPVGNCIGGGLHSVRLNRKKPDFQEFLLIPKEKTFSRAITLNLKAYEYAKKFLHAKKRNDENAWITDKTNEEVLEILKEAAKKYNLRIGVDFASSTFYEKGYYKYKNKELIRDKVEQSDFIERLIKKYNIFYCEDPMQEEDFSGFKEIMNATGKGRLIVGDDLTTTNLHRVRRAVESESINAVIIKPNQIGSLLEVKKVVDFCKKNKIKMIFSHRSGETMDNALADYCIGFGGDFIKCGIYGRERLIKLKRIIDIERKD